MAVSRATGLPLPNGPLPAPVDGAVQVAPSVPLAVPGAKETVGQAGLDVPILPVPTTLPHAARGVPKEVAAMDARTATGGHPVATVPKASPTPIRALATAPVPDAGLPLPVDGPTQEALVVSLLVALAVTALEVARADAATPKACGLVQAMPGSGLPVVPVRRSPVAQVGPV